MARWFRGNHTHFQNCWLQVFTWGPSPNISQLRLTLFEISTTEGWVDVMYSAADSMGPYVPWAAAGGLDGEPPVNSHNDLEHLWLPLPKRIYIPKFCVCFPYLSSNLLEGGTYNTPQITFFALYGYLSGFSLGRSAGCKPHILSLLC